MQVHRGVEYKVPVSAEVEAAFIAADVDGSGFICIYCVYRYIVSTVYCIHIVSMYIVSARRWRLPSLPLTSMARGSYVSLMLEHLSQMLRPVRVSL